MAIASIAFFLFLPLKRLRLFSPRRTEQNLDCSIRPFLSSTLDRGLLCDIDRDGDVLSSGLLRPCSGRLPDALVQSRNDISHTRQELHADALPVGTAHQTQPSAQAGDLLRAARPGRAVVDATNLRLHLHTLVRSREEPITLLKSTTTRVFILAIQKLAVHELAQAAHASTLADAPNTRRKPAEQPADHLPRHQVLDGPVGTARTDLLDRNVGHVALHGRLGGGRAVGAFAVGDVGDGAEIRHKTRLLEVVLHRVLDREHQGTRRLGLRSLAVDVVHSAHDVLLDRSFGERRHGCLFLGKV